MSDQPSIGTNVPIQSITEIAGAIKRTVEGAFSRVRVRGEISRPTYARSGHLYLTLKDEKAVLDAVAWRGTVSKLSIRAEEGMEVIAEGRLTTYPGSSKYQLVMDRMELAGEGALLKLLEERKRKLATEGLFEEGRKKPLPFLPQRIGVVTSPTGAVIRDILHRLHDRFPSHVMVWPVKVQGQGADREVAAAIRGFGAMPPGERPDLLIVARGGGSLEDLWTFNEEVVARAVAETDIPLVSAIGHETDTTLIDFVSDKRAPTPTAAAEMAVPIQHELLAAVREWDARLHGGLLARIDRARTQLEGLARGLVHPERLLETMVQRIDEIGMRLEAASNRIVPDRGRLVADLTERLKPSVLRSVGHARQRFDQEGQLARLNASAAHFVERKRERLATLATQLTALESGERRALERGYARVYNDAGSLLTSASASFEGPLKLEFHDGMVTVNKGNAAPLAPKSKVQRSKDQGPQDETSTVKTSQGQLFGDKGE